MENPAVIDRHLMAHTSTHDLGKSIVLESGI